LIKIRCLKIANLTRFLKKAELPSQICKKEVRISKKTKSFPSLLLVEYQIITSIFKNKIHLFANGISLQLTFLQTG